VGTGGTIEAGSIRISSDASLDRVLDSTTGSRHSCPRQLGGQAANTQRISFHLTRPLAHTNSTAIAPSRRSSTAVGAGSHNPPRFGPAPDATRPTAISPRTTAEAMGVSQSQTTAFGQHPSLSSNSPNSGSAPVTGSSDLSRNYSRYFWLLARSSPQDR